METFQAENLSLKTKIKKIDGQAKELEEILSQTTQRLEFFQEQLIINYLEDSTKIFFRKNNMSKEVPLKSKNTDDFAKKIERKFQKKEKKFRFQIESLIRRVGESFISSRGIIGHNLHSLK